MISGSDAAKRRFAAALFAVALGLLCGGAAAQAGPPPAPAASAAPWGIEQLMQGLAQIKSARARFVERKYLAILNSPLESSGTLVYTAPDRLEKRVLMPKPETLVLERDRFTIESASRRRTLELNDYPVIRAFVESIRSTLAGDLRTLTRYYRVKLDGNRSRWRLILTPGEPEMQDAVREIRIGGSDHRIDAIEIVEAQGDRSVMTIAGDAP